MKPKILILTPVYNDWENLIKLLNKINKIFIKEIKSRFDLIVVDDFSNEKIHYENLKLKSINKLKIIKLHKNHGSQRALAIGLKFIKEFYSKNYFGISWCHFRSVKKQTRVFRLFTAIFGL